MYEIISKLVSLVAIPIIFLAEMMRTLMRDNGAKAASL